jgi:hypothetical protein
MLGVKILINLQAGLSRPRMLLHTSDFSAGCASSCLETIEVIDPFFQSVCSAANRDWGICSIRIDFQLGTNGGDAN